MDTVVGVCYDGGGEFHVLVTSVSLSLLAHGPSFCSHHCG
jgi:hypothetical protein